MVQSVGWSEVWSVSKGFLGQKGVLLLALTLLMLAVGTLRWKEILRHQGYFLPLASLFKQYIGGFALSFFFPMVFFGGELFRSYAIKEFHGVPLQRAIVSVTVERFLELTAYLFFLAAGIAYLLVSRSVSVPQFFWWVLWIEN